MRRIAFILLLPIVVFFQLLAYTAWGIVYLQGDYDRKSDRAEAEHTFLPLRRFYYDFWIGGDLR